MRFDKDFMSGALSGVQVDVHGGIRTSRCGEPVCVWMIGRIRVFVNRDPPDFAYDFRDFVIDYHEQIHYAQALVNSPRNISLVNMNLNFTFI